MRGLPHRPDLDQLRRQARELLRAALVGEPAAITRIHVVAPQLTLSAAQLALAREYGFRSWPALRAEAEIRRLTALAEGQPPAGGAEPGPPPAFGDRWSFGGAGAIETLTGLLQVEGLVAGPDGARLFARLLSWDSAPEPAATGGQESDFAGELNAMEALARFGDIAVVDDQGTPYTLGRTGTSTPPGLEWADFEFRVDPVPGPDARWLEFSGQSGTATRLLPSARVAARAGEVTPVTGNPAERDLARRTRSVMGQWLNAPAGSRDHNTRNARASLLATTAQARQADMLEPASDLPDQVARLCAALTGQSSADGLPAPWAGMLTAADQPDGPRHHLDIGVTLPPVAGVTIRLDALICAPGSRRLHLRSVGRWPVEVRRDGNGNLKDKWRSMEISADDDRGNSYVSSFGGHSYMPGGIIEHSSVTFWPRLDPLARRLRLTVTGPADQVTIDLELGPVSGANRS
jgi:hypothetical protein